MRNFVLGIVITLVVLLIGGLGLALLGFLPTRANSTPPATEVHLAMSALDNSVERHAAHVNNPDAKMAGFDGEGSVLNLSAGHYHVVVTQKIGADTDKCSFPVDLELLDPAH